MLKKIKKDDVEIKELGKDVSNLENERKAREKKKKKLLTEANIKMHKQYRVNCSCEGLKLSPFFKYLGLCTNENLERNLHTDCVCEHIRSLTSHRYFFSVMYS